MMKHKSADAFRTIREVADWLDVPTHVLRFWESKFSDIKPVKGAGGRRYYRPQDIVLLGGIKTLLYDQGLTIRGTQKMIADKGVEVVAAFSAEPQFDEAPAEHKSRKIIRKDTQNEAPFLNAGDEEDITDTMSHPGQQSDAQETKKETGVVLPFGASLASSSTSVGKSLTPGPSTEISETQQSFLEATQTAAEADKDREKTQIASVITETRQRIKHFHSQHITLEGAKRARLRVLVRRFKGLAARLHAEQSF